MAIGRGAGGEIPASTGSVNIEWGYGPGSGWGLRRRVRRAKRQLEVQGFEVTTCVVGRKYKLGRMGALPRASEPEQDRLGLAAVLKAHRRDAQPGGGPAGVREPRRPRLDPGSLAATAD